YFGTSDGLSNQQVRSIYEDAQGNVWFECGQGISRFDGQGISVQQSRNYLLPDMWQAAPEDLWFKGDEINAYNAKEGQPGVYRYDGTQLSFKGFPIDTVVDSKTLYSVSTPFVRGKGGRLWFGTYGAVFGYDGTTFTMIDNRTLTRAQESGNLHVRSIHEDRDGNLWIGNNGIGVLVYDGEKLSSFSRKYGLRAAGSEDRGGYRSPEGSLEHVFAIGEDREGNLWFGDRDTGAWRFDGKKVQNFTAEHGLPTPHIWQIYQSQEGDLWFAMDNGSVCRFNGERFERIF
ncbi:MAG: two-component regulator propeller domain-containing protein, partial [Bacteroidota bacterium]